MDASSGRRGRHLRYGTIPAMKRNTEQWVVAGLAVAVALVLIVIAWLRRDREPEPEPVEEAPAAEVVPATPRHPVRPPIDAGPGDEELVPLPPLADSDRFFSMELGDVVGDVLEEQLADEAVIEKFVATIDNLPRERIAERLRPADKLPGSFEVQELPDTAAGDAPRYTWAPGNEQRYDVAVQLFTGAPTDELVDLYRRFYPLFQEAYVNLGYPDGYFNDRVIEVIDHLLATPDIAEPPELERPHVLYQYADPELEALSGGQKMMLRMGSEHRAAVRNKLGELRAALTDTASPDAGGE